MSIWNQFERTQDLIFYCLLCVDFACVRFRFQNKDDLQTCFEIVSSGTRTREKESRHGGQADRNRIDQIMANEMVRAMLFIA